MFMQNDNIKYVGRKYSGDLKGSIGRILNKIEGSERGYVTEFPIHGKNGPQLHAFVMDVSNIELHIPTAKEAEKLQADLDAALISAKNEVSEPVKKTRRRTVEVVA